ncbi:MAG TPA: hypothetical protein PKA76_19170 [Pirellulaceae bacterium]|nr:hypothetical protein [Pirellulaceae bacterium]
MHAEIMEQPKPIGLKITECPEELGFKSGTKSVHTSRTMMLADFAVLLERVPSLASAKDYSVAIIEHNELGKPTRSTRKMTAEVFARLYGLDPKLPTFQTFRKYWDLDDSGRPVLAFLLAATRDPLLREATGIVLARPIGDVVSSTEIAAQLSELYPQRFQASTSIATAQRLASSWAQAGYLIGKARKRRSKPSVTPLVACFAISLAYLCGFRGGMLLDNIWTKLLDCTPVELHEKLLEASKQGWLNYKSAGSVVEITFPNFGNVTRGRSGYESN